MNAIKSRNLKFWSVLTLCMLMVSGAAASAFFYQSPGSVGGKPANQIGVLWQQWALTQPTPKSPLLDTTGVNCGQGQPRYSPTPANNIWWLAGTVDGTPVTRSCNVPLTRTVVFPIVNGAYFAFPEDPASQKTDDFLKSQIAYVKTGASNLSVTLDGQPLSNPASYYTLSSRFSVTLPADNIYGLSGQDLNLGPAFDAGYYVGITLYVPGRHVLKFKGTLTQTNADGTQTVSNVDVTYNLNVGVIPG